MWGLLVWVGLLGAAHAYEQPVLQTPNLRARLQSEGAALGNVAEQLLSVQSDVNRVERESLGKVFDLETLRTFFAGHQQLVAENDALKGLVDQLKKQIEPMTTQLNQLQAQVVEAQAKAAESAAGLAAKDKQLLDAQQVATAASAAAAQEKAAAAQAQAKAAADASAAEQASRMAEQAAEATAAKAKADAADAAAKAKADAGDSASAELDEARAQAKAAGDEVAKLKQMCQKVKTLQAENAKLKEGGEGGADLEAENANLKAITEAQAAELASLKQQLAAPPLPATPPPPVVDVGALEASLKEKDSLLASTKHQSDELSKQLVVQHEYGLKCHDQLAACGREVSHLKSSAVSPCEVANQAEMLGSSQTQNRDLASKNQHLQQELTREELETEQVKYQSSQEFLKLKATIGTLETHSEAVETALKDTAAKKMKVEEEVQLLKKQVLGSSTKMLEHQMHVLQQELQLNNAALEKSQFAEAEARSAAQQAASYQKAAEETARLNAEAAKKAAEIAQQQVTAAQMDSVKATNKAAAEIAGAQVDLSKNCEDVWDERNADFNKVKEELATCKSDSTTMKAQVQLLSQAAAPR